MSNKSPEGTGTDSTGAVDVVEEAASPAKFGAEESHRPEGNAVASGNATADASQASDRAGIKLLYVLVGVPIVLIVMLLCFLTPSLNSGASNLPLAVAGPEQATKQIAAALEAKRPGAFEITTYDDAASARQAVKNRDEIGAIALGADGVTIVTASGAGTPYASLLKNLGAGLQAQGQKVAYDDVAPLPADDPAGVSLSSLALPLAFGGNVSAILLMTLLKRHPRLRLVGSILMSITAGLAIATVLQFGFGTLEGNFWMTAGVLSLGILAISLTLIGAKDLFGYAGLGFAAFLLLFVSNPLSGLGTGPQWLPAPWGTIGQMMPIGAAGTAVRSAAFFDGAGAGTAVLVLICWAFAGLAMSALGGQLTRKGIKATGAGPTEKPARA